MIKVQNINKIYNKNKRNALHALNNVEVTFPTKGLVVLLGESGSGKTTLLNVIGGMDKFDSGKLHIDEKTIEGYDAKILDQIRSNQIGMVFQNYYLLPHETVYENIAITLRLIGITEQEEIDKRIDYLLDAVGLPKYKKRLANQLSGGEQQRIAIARALAKNPRLLLADEPTGNLDSKNTIAIMEIIKQVSAEKLVIMVTHERELADFYADKIIELEDGKIIRDVENTSNGNLDYTSGSDIYLGDLTHETLTSEHSKIELYTDNKSVKLSPRLIYLNGTMYLDLQDTPAKKLVNVKDRPDINIYKESLGETVETKIKPFDFDKISSTTPKEKAVDPIDFKTVFKQTMTRFLSATKGQKLLFFSFAIGAMILTYAIASIFNVITVRDDDFLVLPREAISINKDNMTHDDLASLQNHHAIDEVLMLNHIAIFYEIPRIFSTASSTQEVTSAIIDSARLSEADLTHGDLPSTPYEIVIDAGWMRRHIINRDPFHSLNLTQPEQMLNFKLMMPVNGDFIPFEVVGIVDLETPVIYGHHALMVELAQPFHVLELHEENLELVSGVLPSETGEILYAADYADPDLIDNFSSYEVTISGETYQVVGLYRLKTIDSYHPITLKETAEHLLFKLTDFPSQERFIIANDVSSAEEYLQSLSFEATHIYSTTRSEYLARQIQESRPTLVFAGFIIGAMVLSFYFVIRSSMIHRIYEIGVFRSLGTKKRHILKRFVYESAIITTFSSLLGYILMNYLLINTQAFFGDDLRIVYISLQTIIVGLIVIYGINILSGMIPVYVLLRKSPAQINTQYDV